MGRHTLGNPNCPKCKGEGVTPGSPRKILRQDGTETEYPTVVRCGCLEKPIELSPADPGRPKLDAQERAAGEKE